MASSGRIDRETGALVALFGIPPAIGTTLAGLRVMGSESLPMAVGFGLAIGVAVAAVVAILAVTGSPDQDVSS